MCAVAGLAANHHATAPPPNTAITIPPAALQAVVCSGSGRQRMTLGLGVDELGGGDVTQGDAQWATERFKRCGSGVDLASLDATDVGLGDSRCLGELLLGQTRGEALLQHEGGDPETSTRCVQLAALLVGAPVFDLANEVVKFGCHLCLLAAGHQ